MKKLIEKLKFFEVLIDNFAKSKLELAYDSFYNNHGYDLRETKNSDHLIFKKWRIENYADGRKVIILRYVEITNHDCPYRIELEFNINDIFIQNKPL